MIGLSLFSAAGIPPMVGFYAKLAVIQAAMSHSQYLVVAVGVMTSVVSAGFYLSIVAGIAFKQPQGRLTYIHLSEVPTVTDIPFSIASNDQPASRFHSSPHRGRTTRRDQLRTSSTPPTVRKGGCSGVWHDDPD